MSKIDRTTFLTYAEQALRLPIMKVDVARKQVRLGIGGELMTLSEPLSGTAEISSSLSHLERYVGSVDWGEAVDPHLAKMAMFEAMLYLLAAPFANEQMKVLRQRYGALERRGPKVLYLVGLSSNGKTTFLQFALWLLTGRQIRPLPASDLTKTKVQNAIALRTNLPLVFDDVNPVLRAGFEEIIKSYWEEWWTPDGVSPQIVIASNNPSLKEWAKSRVKRIDFDVHFAPSEQNKAKLALLFSRPTPVFRWFSTLYLADILRLTEPHDDELYVAREVMRTLYERAERDIPAFFPQRPLEDVYDPGRIKWLDLLHRTRQATSKRDGARLIVTFADDLQHHEVKQYASSLPQTLKSEVRGKKIILDNPDAFSRWLNDQESRGTRWISKLLHRKG